MRASAQKWGALWQGRGTPIFEPTRKLKPIQTKTLNSRGKRKQNLQEDPLEGRANLNKLYAGED